MRKILLFFVIISLIISCSNDNDNSSQEESLDSNTAVMVFSIGDVRISQNEVWKASELNMVLNQGDLIETGEKSRCNIVIGKDSYVSVKENSKLVLEQLTLNPDGSENTDIELKVGKSVINPKKLMKNDNFNVKTPTSVAAVRGTKFVVETEPGKKVKVSVVEGKVAFKKRITAVEQVEGNGESANQIVDKINQKLEEDTTIIEANQAAEIDNKKVETLNANIEEVLEDVKQAEIAKDANANSSDSNLSIDQSETMQNIEKKLVAIDELNDKEAVIEVKQDVPKQIIADAADLDTFVEENKAEIKEAVKIAEESKEIAAVNDSNTNSVLVEEDVVKVDPQKDVNVVTIISPEKRSRIYINGKYWGNGAVEYKLNKDLKASVLIKTKGYHDYRSEIEWEKDGSRKIKPSLEKNALLDRIAWKVDLQGEVKGKIVKYNNILIVPSSNGSLTALNATGNVIWRKKLSDGIESMPQIYKSNIYVVTKDAKIYSLNVKNGKINFKSDIQGTLLFNSAPVITKEGIFLGTTAGYVYKLDFNGKTKWEKNINVGIYATPIIDNKYIYIGTDSKLFFALKKSKGSVAWKTTLDSRIVSSSPLFFEKNIVVSTYKGTVYSLSKSRGKEVWKQELDEIILSSPVLDKSAVIIATKKGSLVSINSKNGKINWKYKFPSPIINSPVIANNRMYLTVGSAVYELNRKNGKPIWQVDVGSQIKTEVTVAGKNLIIGNKNGETISVRTDLRNIVK